MQLPLLVPSLQLAVVVGDDLQHEQVPVVGFYYRLVLALSTERVPTVGIQLRRGARRCGWVRVEHLPLMRDILDRGQEIKGTILSREQFIWNGSICYWGILEWYIVPERKVVAN